jgi:dihydroxyacid dehydratase/phosphogluconate dehydratase
LPITSCNSPIAITMPNNERSKHVTQGVARSANRAMYYAMGYQDEDFDKPMIGVANGHSTITPCNAGLQQLADAAIAEIRKCGANASPPADSAKKTSRKSSVVACRARDRVGACTPRTQ